MRRDGMGCAGSHNDDGTALGISSAQIVFVEKLHQSKSVTDAAGQNITKLDLSNSIKWRFAIGPVDRKLRRRHPLGE
jgi:hypothetical protein